MFVVCALFQALRTMGLGMAAGGPLYWLVALVGRPEVPAKPCESTEDGFGGNERCSVCAESKLVVVVRSRKVAAAAMSLGTNPHPGRN